MAFPYEMFTKPTEAEKKQYAGLEKYKCPNLVAEIRESNYSMCTLSDHMGLGRCQENDPVINGKIFGSREILLNEALGLCHLFNCEAEYLFSDQLETYEERPLAYYHHYEMNRRQEADRKRRELCDRLSQVLKERPELFNIVETLLSGQVLSLLSEQQKMLENLLGGEDNGSAEMCAGSRKTPV